MIIFLTVFITLQFLLGGFPFALMAFPLNAILFVLWIMSLLMMWKKGRQSTFVIFMLSNGATYTSIGLLLISCIVIGITGNRSITGSWPFVFVLLYFQTVLFYVILRGWRAPTATGARLGSIRWRFILLHSGLFVTVASAFWGAPDTDVMRIQAYIGSPVSEAVHMDGSKAWLDYEVVINEFVSDYDDYGVPADYSAHVVIGDEDVVLKVNHPYSIGFGKDLYLSGYDVNNNEFCILQIVNEPWKYGALIGIIMILAGALLLFLGGPGRYS